LLDISQKTRKSLSALTRDLITEQFAAKPADVATDPAFQIIALGNSGHKNTARTHDAELYGKKS